MKIKARELKPGMLIKQPAVPSAGLKGGTYRVAAVGRPYEAPDGLGTSTYVRIKYEPVNGAPKTEGPTLADALIELA